jgi:hypothetical protein
MIINKIVTQNLRADTYSLITANIADSGVAGDSGYVIAGDFRASSNISTVIPYAIRAQGNVLVQGGITFSNGSISSTMYGASAYGGYILNWNFELGNINWTALRGTPTYSTVTDGKVGRGIISSPNGDSIWVYSTEYIPVGDTGRSYMVSGWFRRSSGFTSGKSVYLAVKLAKADYSNIGGAGTWWLHPASSVAPGTTWTRYVAVFGAYTANYLPPTAKYMQIGIILNYSSGACGDYNYQAQGLRIDDFTYGVYAP